MFLDKNSVTVMYSAEASAWYRGLGLHPFFLQLCFALYA